MELTRIVYVLVTLCSRPLDYGEAMEYAYLYHRTATRWALPVEVVLGVALYENHACDPNAISSTNDVGLMQIHTRGGRQIKIYQRPSWNIERGCEKLWAQRKKLCWGRPGQDNCLMKWLQGYNPGSRNYGYNVTKKVKKVKKVSEKFDAEIESWMPWFQGRPQRDGG